MPIMEIVSETAVGFFLLVFNGVVLTLLVIFTIWEFIGFFVWKAIPTPAVPIPPTGPPPCFECVVIARKWALMNPLQKSAALVHFLLLQLGCLARGCGFRL